MRTGPRNVKHRGVEMLRSASNIQEMSGIEVYINPLPDRNFTTPANHRTPLVHHRQKHTPQKNKKLGGIPKLMYDACVILGVDPKGIPGICWIADHIAVNFGSNTRFVDRKKARWILQEFVSGRANRENFSEVLAGYQRPARSQNQPQKPQRKHHHKKHKSHRKNGDEWWDKYEAYINSPKWKMFRRGVIKVRGNKCEDCSIPGPGLHLHHLTYERLGNEIPEDVTLLCEPCHQERHPHKRISRQQNSAFANTRSLKAFPSETPEVQIGRSVCET